MRITLTRISSTLALVALIVMLAAGVAFAAPEEGEDCETCEPQVLEGPRKFRTCGIGTHDEIIVRETAELEGLFQGACEEPCELVIEMEVSMTEEKCQNLKGEIGVWTDVKYIVFCT